MHRMGLQTDLNASDQSRIVEFDEMNEIRVGRERDENKIFIAKWKFVFPVHTPAAVHNNQERVCMLRKRLLLLRSINRIFNSWTINPCRWSGFWGDLPAIDKRHSREPLFNHSNLCLPCLLGCYPNQTRAPATICTPLIIRFPILERRLYYTATTTTTTDRTHCDKSKQMKYLMQTICSPLIKQKFQRASLIAVGREVVLYLL